MTKDEPPGKTWPLYLLVSGYLILRCLWRLFVPGGSWPMPPYHYISIGSDVLLLGVMIALSSQLKPKIAGNPSRVKLANRLFWAALAAGAILILLRFTSTAAWWTGHLRSMF